MELKIILQKYRDITIDLINEINIDGNIEKFLKQRDQLLVSLSGNTIDKDELRVVYSELGIAKLEQEANEGLVKLRDSIKNEMIELKNQKNAARGYNNSFKNINFINKHI